MNNNKLYYWLFFYLILLTSCNGQNPKDARANTNLPSFELNKMPTSIALDTIMAEQAPQNITRNIIQDKAGDIWFSTFEGVIKYDGESFTNMTADVSQSRFFSIMEDRIGDIWLGTIGSGVYRYDGQTFENFTTDDGLFNNEVVCIYEDKKGHIWLGVNGGMSRYDGQQFYNFKIDRDTIIPAATGEYHPNMDRPPNGVNTIIQDKKGQFWFGTSGSTYLYDRKSFSVVKQDSHAFSNVRSIIEDSKDNIWLGGNDGLWRYDGSTYTEVGKLFVGFIYEDRQGHIWVSSESTNQWALSRYYISSDNEDFGTVTEIISGEGMIFGILEDQDGHVWTGTLGGVCRYDGERVLRYLSQ